MFKNVLILFSVLFLIGCTNRSRINSRAIGIQTDILSLQLEFNKYVESRARGLDSRISRLESPGTTSFIPDEEVEYE